MQAEREREHAADRAARLALREQQRRRELVRSGPRARPKTCRAIVLRSTQLWTLSMHLLRPCSGKQTAATLINLLLRVPNA